MTGTTPDQLEAATPKFVTDVKYAADQGGAVRLLAPDFIAFVMVLLLFRWVRTMIMMMVVKKNGGSSCNNNGNGNDNDNGNGRVENKRSDQWQEAIR